MCCANYQGQRIDTVIIGACFKDTNTLYQCSGRSFRSEDPLIIYIVDDNNLVVKHWRLCRRWFLDNNCIEMRSVDDIDELF